MGWDRQTGAAPHLPPMLRARPPGLAAAAPSATFTVPRAAGEGSCSGGDRSQRWDVGVSGVSSSLAPWASLRSRRS